MQGKTWIGISAMVAAAAIAYWLAGGDPSVRPKVEPKEQPVEASQPTEAGPIVAIPSTTVEVPVVPSELPRPVEMAGKPVPPAVAQPEMVPGPKNPLPRDDPAKEEAESIALNIRQYRLRFGGNPVGTNADIVKELDGGNPKTARYLPSELKRLNEQGELIDSWGTPYFFHQLSAEEMETRSAGPDRELWTTDDVVSK
jgi:hypothetical protein